MKIYLALLSLWLLSACTIVYVPRQPAAITAQEQQLLRHPPSGLMVMIEQEVPRVSAATREAEAIALKNGRKLNEEELAFARRVGVKHPEKIRIYFTNNFPIDESALGPGGAIVGLTMNYGIFIKPEMLKRPNSYREVIVHEFAHVVQFETLGVEGMSRRFMLETYVLQDKLIPIERDAIAMGNAVYDDPETQYGI